MHFVNYKRKRIFYFPLCWKDLVRNVNVNYYLLCGYYYYYYD